MTQWAEEVGDGLSDEYDIVRDDPAFVPTEDNLSSPREEEGDNTEPTDGILGVGCSIDAQYHTFRQHPLEFTLRYWVHRFESSLDILLCREFTER